MYQGNSNLTVIHQHDSDSQSSPNSNKKTYVCPHPDCGKIFRFKSEIVRHSATHVDSRPFQCEYDGCGKSFKRADALENHIRTHTGETPYVCEYPGCGMSFTTKASLRYHFLKHKNDKIYKCTFPGCNKSFITLFQLKQHEKSVSVHKKLAGKCEEGSCSEHSYSDGKNSDETDFSETYMFPLYQPNKVVNVDNVKQDVYFENQYEQQSENNYNYLMKENENLKNKLEVSEKLLYMIMQQRAQPEPSNLFLNQSYVNQIPDSFMDQSSYFFPANYGVEEF